MTTQQSSDRISFQLPLAVFPGTIDELLEAVARGHVPVEQIPVSEITAAFREVLVSSQPLDLESAAEFLSATARLLALKSSRLLLQPTVEEYDAGEPRSIDPLRDRIVSAASDLRRREGIEIFPPLSPGGLVTPRVQPHPPGILARVWQDMVARQAPCAERVLVPGFVRVEVAISRLIGRLRGGPISLLRVLRGSSRNDAVIHFLAVLELVRRRETAASQAHPFEDITLRPYDASADAATRAG